jgi:hypothetical protein
MSGQFGEIFQGLGGGTLMGIITLSIVFLALSGIALIIFGVKYLVAIVDASERKPKAPEKAVSVDGGKIPAAAKSAASPGGADEGEILAAISAAVAVMFGGLGRSWRSARQSGRKPLRVLPGRWPEGWKVSRGSGGPGISLGGRMRPLLGGR